jgi:pimeloyl-ACP methyl ester carboxylesterase
MEIFEFKENKININGIDLFYKIAGKGKPVIILHGWGASSFSWMRIIDEMAPKGFQLIIPDLPGFGKTNAPDSVWGVLDYANFIADFIKEIEVKDFTIIGHSFGGSIASKLLGEKHIGKKVIFCDAAIIREERLSFRQKISKNASRLGKKIISKDSFAYKFFEKLTYLVSGTYDYYSANPLMKEVFKKVVSEDLTYLLEKINVPCLIIWGENDKVTPTEDAYLINKKIKNSKLKIIKDAGHNPHNTHSEEVAKAIVDFLNK